MTHHDDLDRQLTAWLEDPHTPPAPRYLAEVLEQTRRTRQRRAWASLERWLPMTVITHPTMAQPLRYMWLLLITVLLASLTAGAIIVGSQLLESFRFATAVIPQGNDAVFVFGSLSDGDDGQPDGDIYTVRADGTDLRQLTIGPGIDEFPSWSPDGTRVAYRHREAGTESLVVIDSGGGSAVTLATNDLFQSCDAPWNVAWSPDGTSLIFPIRDACGPHDLNVVAADGSSPATRLVAPGTNGLYATWSPDGTKIAFVGSETPASTGLYLIDVGPEGVLSGGLLPRRIGPDLGPNLTNTASVPRWSPDGSEIAVALREGSGFVTTSGDSIRAIRADGSGDRLVAEFATRPSWSPDGQWIAFQRPVDPTEYWNDRPCTTRTWIVAADGTGERRLEDLGDGCLTEPLWSPDGTRLASLLIASTPDEPELAFHLGIVMADESEPAVILPDTNGGSWQPVAAVLRPTASSEVATTTSSG